MKEQHSLFLCSFASPLFIMFCNIVPSNIASFEPNILSSLIRVLDVFLGLEPGAVIGRLLVQIYLVCTPQKACFMPMH